MLVDPPSNNRNVGLTANEETETQCEAENVKEMTQKLSASAPPFNPSVSVPGMNDQGGILPH